MNLVWHIVRKDLRRMALPVVVWNAFVLASNLWFRLATPTLVGHVPSEVSIWIQELAITSGLFVGIDLALAYVFAGALVLEDRVVGSTQFWPTRPIRPLQLLGAKAICAGACFVVLPTFVLLPVWLSVAQTTQVPNAAVRFAMVHAGVALVGLALGSLVRSTVELIFASIGGVLLLFAGMWLRLVPPVWPVLMGLRTPATQFLLAAVLSLFAAVAFIQFAWRLTRRSWFLVAAGVIASCSIGLHLSLAVATPTLKLPLTSAAADVRALTVPTAFEIAWPKAQPRVVVTTPWQERQFLAPAVVRNAAGDVVLGPAPDWAKSVALLLLPVLHPTTLRWPLGFTANAGSREPDLVGSLEVWKAHAIIIGDARLVVGRRSASNAGALRVVSVQKLASGDHDVFFEERMLETRSPLHPVTDMPIDPWVDAYFLVDEAEHAVRDLGLSQPVRSSMNSDAVAFRNFILGAHWIPERQHLVKIRIMIDERLQMPISIRGLVETWSHQRDAQSPANRTSP